MGIKHLTRYFQEAQRHVAEKSPEFALRSIPASDETLLPKVVPKIVDSALAGAEPKLKAPQPVVVQ